MTLFIFIRNNLFRLLHLFADKESSQDSNTRIVLFSGTPTAVQSVKLSQLGKPRRVSPVRQTAAGYRARLFQPVFSPSQAK